jgi:hypothetical protein
MKHHSLNKHDEQDHQLHILSLERKAGVLDLRTVCVSQLTYWRTNFQRTIFFFN